MSQEASRGEVVYRVTVMGPDMMAHRRYTDDRAVADLLAEGAQDAGQWVDLSAGTFGDEPPPPAPALAGMVTAAGPWPAAANHRRPTEAEYLATLPAPPKSATYPRRQTWRRLFTRGGRDAGT